MGVDFRQGHRIVSDLIRSLQWKVYSEVKWKRIRRAPGTIPVGGTDSWISGSSLRCGAWFGLLHPPSFGSEVPACAAPCIAHSEAHEGTISVGLPLVMVRNPYKAICEPLQRKGSLWASSPLDQ